jgi:hypothetical protein
MLRFFCTSQNLLMCVDQRLLAVGVAIAPADVQGRLPAESVVWKLVKLLLTRQRFCSQFPGDGLKSRGLRIILGLVGFTKHMGTIQ